MRRGVVGGMLVAAVMLAGKSADPRAAESGTVTFTKDVAPILQRSCQTCHRPGAMAPMSLLTYNDARPWARAIKAKVVSRQMPPWFLDRTVGGQEFKNDPSLTDQEIATIAAWVDAGAPMGNPADMPPPRNFDDLSVWTLPGGAPDLVVTAPPHTVKANTPNSWVDLTVDIPLEEDRWVMAYQAKPSLDGVRVVHHLSGTIIEPEGKSRAGFHYVPGKPGTVYGEGTGYLLKKGARFNFNMHYTGIDRDVTDRSMVAFKFYPKGYRPKYVTVRPLLTSLEDIDLPAGESNIRHDDYSSPLRENLRILAYFPHFHLSGKRQCVELIYPNGRIETMNCVGFNFEWQMIYTYAEHAQPLLPKGTIVHAINWYDNSAANKLNPDPRNWKGYGNRSTDEMGFVIVEAVALTDEQYKQELEARQQRQTSSN